MPMIGRRNQYRIQLFNLQKFAMIVEPLRARRLRQRLIEPRPIHVANGFYIDGRVLLEHAHHEAPAIARADQAEVDAVVCAQDSLIRCSGKHGCGAKQVASVQHNGISISQCQKKFTLSEEVSPGARQPGRSHVPAAKRSFMKCVPRWKRRPTRPERSPNWCAAIRSRANRKTAPRAY